MRMTRLSDVLESTTALCDGVACFGSVRMLACAVLKGPCFAVLSAVDYTGLN